MKKLIILFIAAVLSLMTTCSCNIKSNEYAQIKGYDEYISTGNMGYDDIPYFNIENDFPNDNAYQYYKNNNRVVDGYTITDYEDGVCLNRINNTPEQDTEIKIPEKIDGKPVVKIGSYVENDSVAFENIVVCNPFNGATDCTVFLPSSIKYISKVALVYPRFMVEDDDKNKYAYITGFEVNSENPYYSSYEGTLFSKDYLKLLYLKENQSYYCVWVNSIPDTPQNSELSVSELEVFEPANGIRDTMDMIVFHDTPQKINTFIDFGEDRQDSNADLVPNVVIMGQENTEVEKWAKKYNARFVVENP